MENIVKEYIERFDRNHRRQHRYAWLLGVLALLVCLAVFWRLKLVGTAMTNEASCGLQEHTHTDSCYTTVLDCTADTPENGAGEHIHTDACYKRELICTLPEHTHTADCYSDPEADTEGEADWTQAFPQEALTGDWARDTVTIAASQVGYAESTRNWQLNDDGTRGGYTRYGAWYGSPYGGWNGMFAAFCLHYAGVDEDCLTTANAAGVNAWAVALCQAGQLQGPGHEAVPGDIVFLGHDDKIETCAVVADVDAASGVPTLTLIAGDVDNTVAELTVPADSDTILGYAATADAFAAYTQDHPDEKTAADAPGTATPEQDEQEDEDTANERISLAAALEGENKAEGKGGNRATTAGPIDMGSSYTWYDANQNEVTKDYLTSVTAKTESDANKGAEFDKDKNDYKTQLTMGFEIPTKELIAAKGEMYYKLPEGVTIPDGVLGTEYTGTSGTDNAFKFHLEKDGDNYVLKLSFLNEFLEAHKDQQSVIGSLYYNAELGHNTVTDEGKIEIKFSKDVRLEIGTDYIKYDENETLHYNIDTKKTGVYLTEEGKLRYTVTVSTTKGTPDPITVKDALDDKSGSITYNAPTLVSVEKTVNGTTTDVTENAKTKFKVTGTDEAKANGKAFEMELETLPESSDRTTPNSYTIVYEYTLQNPPQNGESDVWQKNTVTASATDTKTKETVKKSAEAKLHIARKVIDKTGSYDGKTQKIHWTITLNEQNILNVTDKKLTDSMFAGDTGPWSVPEDGSNFKVSVKNDQDQDVDAVTAQKTYNVEYATGPDGKQYIKDIHFLDTEGNTTGKNTYKYIIEYDTAAESNWNDTTVHNDATFDGTTKGADVSVGRATGWVEKNVKNQGALDTNGNAIVEWTFTITAPHGGIPAGTEIRDHMSAEGSYNNEYGGRLYLTKAQAVALVNMLQANEHIDPNSITVKTWGNGNHQKVDKFNDDDVIDEVIFKLKTALPEGQKITVTYDTTVHMPNSTVGQNATATFKNQVQVGKEEGSAQVQYTKTGVTKDVINYKDNLEVTRREDGKVHWGVKVFYDKTNPNQDKIFTVIDTLPKGMELTDLWIGYTRQEGGMNNNHHWTYANGTFKKVSNGVGPSTQLEVSGVAVIPNTDGTTTVKATVDAAEYIKNNTFNNFSVNYTCILTQEAWNQVASGKVGIKTLYTNQVKVTTTTNQEYGSANASQNMTINRSYETEAPITKSGEWNGDTKTLSYQLAINPDGVTYLGNGAKLNLTDTLEVKFEDNVEDVSVVNAYLVEGTLQLYHAVKGEDGTLTPGNPVSASSWSWHYAIDKDGNRVITAELPDGMPLLLKYQYKLDYAGNNSSKNIKTENKAKLEGVVRGEDGKQETVTWVKASGGGEVENNYTFVKVDARTAGITVPGAVFEVFVYDGTAAKYTTTGRKYTADGNGTFRIAKSDKDTLGNPYAVNTAYYVKEVSAPAPYKLPSDPPKYYFYFSAPATSNLPENFVRDYKPLDLSKFSNTVYVANTKLSQDIKVEKQWQNADGTALTSDADMQVTIHLKRVAVSQELWQHYTQNQLTQAEKQQLEQLKERVSTDEETAVLSNTTGWTKDFKFKAVETGDSGYYIYFVTEDAIPGYEQTVNETLPQKDANGVWQSAATVINRRKATYELPKTGGSGTTPYMAGGLALMAASLLCGYCRKRRRKEGRQTG